jgi:hypothetical protein
LSHGRELFSRLEKLLVRRVTGLSSAGYFVVSGFESVAFVLCAVLFAQVSAAVGAVLYCEYLAVGAYCAPYECHFVFMSPGFLSVLAMVTKAFGHFLLKKISKLVPNLHGQV